MDIELSLLSKLASIVVHADELIGPDGHVFDKDALRSALNDHEIKLWLETMSSLALAPVKRR